MGSYQINTPPDAEQTENKQKPLFTVPQYQTHPAVNTLKQNFTCCATQKNGDNTAAWLVRDKHCTFVVCCVPTCEAMSTSCGSFRYFPSPSFRKSSKLPVRGTNKDSCQAESIHPSVQNTTQNHGAEVGMRVKHYDLYSKPAWKQFDFFFLQE